MMRFCELQVYAANKSLKDYLVYTQQLEATIIQCRSREPRKYYATVS